jgi:hypothetical protein
VTNDVRQIVHVFFAKKKKKKTVFY